MKRSGLIAVLASLLTVTAMAASKLAAIASKMSSEDCLPVTATQLRLRDESGKLVSLHFDDAKFKVSLRLRFTAGGERADFPPHRFSQKLIFREAVVVEVGIRCVIFC